MTELSVLNAGGGAGLTTGKGITAIMTPDIINQMMQDGVQVFDHEDTITIAGTIQAVQDVDSLMDKLLPTTYRRSLFCVNYEEGRAMRTYRRQN